MVEVACSRFECILVFYFICDRVDDCENLLFRSHGKLGGRFRRLIGLEGLQQGYFDQHFEIMQSRVYRNDVGLQSRCSRRGDEMVDGEMVLIHRGVDGWRG